MFHNITPVILTYNEALNIAKTLNKLLWAHDIVVVDSYSKDETLSLISQYSQTRIFQRTFDSHANQWSFGLKETNIRTEWILALDADYVLSDELISEIDTLNPNKDVFGYQAIFKYCIFGRPLRATVYPPVTVLYRRENASYEQDGHTQRVILNGCIKRLKNPIFHDDRKPLTHWINSQTKYMQLEAEMLLKHNIKDLNWVDRIRLLRFVMPFLMFFYCLFIKGTILDGKAGIFYAFQRMFAELILSMNLLQNDLKKLTKK
jgi:glycosyltransferase involved in cell wall biosynthesis